MKIITTFSKREYEVEDNEAKNIEIAIMSDSRFIKLRNGLILNVSSIESIGNKDDSLSLNNTPKVLKIS